MTTPYQSRPNLSVPLPDHLPSHFYLINESLLNISLIVKVLSVLYTNPDTKFTKKELATRVGTMNLRKVSNSLDLLEEEKFCISCRDNTVPYLRNVYTYNKEIK